MIERYWNDDACKFHRFDSICTYYTYIHVNIKSINKNLSFGQGKAQLELPVTRERVQLIFRYELNQGWQTPENGITWNRNHRESQTLQKISDQGTLTPWMINFPKCLISNFYNSIVENQGFLVVSLIILFIIFYLT